ncbi:GlxA family transcriptional regulator [Vibrio sp. HN007]|uniref:GlxA family transcriptional regulator n=1 Tax=Vibrio iocasae TaxID=3098914 RepID=UPI0035D47D64
MKKVTPISVGIISYPGALTSAIYGLRDMFQVANNLHARREVDNRELVITTIDTEYSLPSEQFQVFILPPSIQDDFIDDFFPVWKSWMLQQHQMGAIACSICAGAFRLAETGILDSRPATTHWALAELFSKNYPKVLLNTDKLIIDDNDVITAGGMMAWGDMGLRIIERFLGKETMLLVSSYFLIEPSGREQSYYSSFKPSLSHKDKQVLKVQHWLQKNNNSVIGMQEMAEVANLSERTLLRRFKKATGYTPSEYLQNVRIDKAKELLKQQLRVDDVAWQVGYKDSNSFRRVFHKVVSLSPSEFRNRFASRYN